MNDRIELLKCAIEIFKLGYRGFSRGDEYPTGDELIKQVLSILSILESELKVGAPAGPGADGRKVEDFGANKMLIKIYGIKKDDYSLHSALKKAGFVWNGQKRCWIQEVGQEKLANLRKQEWLKKLEMKIVRTSHENE